MLPNDVRERMKEGNFKLNGYAQSYYNNLDEAYKMGGEYGVKVQIVYIMTNIRAKKGIQQTIKKELMDYAKQNPIDMTNRG